MKGSCGWLPNQDQVKVSDRIRWATRTKERGEEREEDRQMGRSDRPDMHHRLGNWGTG